MITDVIDYLLTKIDALDDTGKVLDYYPVDKKTGQLAAEAFSENDILNLCIITRPSAEEIQWENADAYMHRILIEYRRTYSGQASQRAFNDVLDYILAAFRADETLGGTVQSRENVQLTQSEEQWFYKWLVHYARIEISVEL